MDLELNRPHTYEHLATILDNIDALVYVADMQTYEILYMNAYGRSIWGDYQGKVCWQTLQTGQTAPCSFCTNHLLLDENNNAKEPYVWEFQNTVVERWYQCRDEAIKWDDGRMVRLEIATDITQMKVLESELKAAMEKAEKLARIDELTNLYNRRAFLELAEREINEAKRFNKAISVLMIDLDKFKTINDTFGHQMGDNVLEVFADIMRSVVRSIDIIGRLGGEEFALVLPETTLEHALVLAERLRQEVEESDIVDIEEVIKFTTSIGVYEGDPKEQSIETMLHFADNALFSAKAKGRNCVVFTQER